MKAKNRMGIIQRGAAGAAIQLTLVKSAFVRSAATLGIGFSLLLGSPASAATVTVTSLADDGEGSLRQAILDAEPGDTIDFAVIGAIELNTELAIDKDLIIEGPGAEDLTLTLHSFAVGRILRVENHEVTVSGLTLSGGLGGIPLVNGAAILNDGGTLVVSHCIFSRNHSGDGDGGGIYNQGGALLVSNCLFVRNTTRGPFSDIEPPLGKGGAIANGPGGALHVRHSTFVRNFADEEGGAIYHAGTSLAVINSIFWDNSMGQISLETPVRAGSVTYSTVQGGFPGVGNLQSDPKFVREPFTLDSNDLGDLRLTSKSPCIENGFDDGNLADTDLDGNPRLFWLKPDMGAYEFQGYPVELDLILEMHRFLLLLESEGVLLPADGLPLRVKLDEIAESLESGRMLTRVDGLLQAFIEEVNALWRAGFLTGIQRDTLVESAEMILMRDEEAIRGG